MVMQDKMSLEFLKQFCGDKFDQVKYNALHDEHGMVSKDMLMSTVMDGIAREVYYTYISYCPTGYMDVDEYSKMLRAAKFFSKAFNRPSAEVLFHAARFSIDESKLAVNFYTFIKQILPKLAEQRGTTGDQLFDKLAFVELGIGNHEMVETKPSLGASLLMATAAVASISHKQGPMPADTAPTPEQEKAATFLQTKARGKNAKRQVEEMRQVNQFYTNLRKFDILINV